MNTQTLLKVNNHAYSTEEAIRRLLYREQDQADSYITELLVREFADKNNISNTDEELKVALEEMRYTRGLEFAENFKNWLEQTGQTLLSIQNELDYQLLQNKVKASFSDEEVEQYLKEHRPEFDKAELYGIQVSSLEAANALLEKINSGENFYLLAMEHSEDITSKPSAGYLGTLTLAELPSDVAEAVSKGQSGDVVGPFSSEQGYTLVKLGAIKPGALPESIFDLRDRLFENLVSALKKEANIESFFSAK